MLQRAGDLRRDVLHERAAAGDVQHLHAAADGENRQIARAGGRDEGDLELVARRIDVLDPLMRRLAVSRGLDVAAAGQQQAVDARQRLLDRHRRVEDAHLAAGVKDRLPVVFELPARGNGDERHIYIRDGTSIPINSRARQLRPEVRNPGRAPPFPLDLFLAENLVPMIERIEHLREPEGILRQDREFERSHDLIHHFVEPRRLEHERPQVQLVYRIRSSPAMASKCAADIHIGQPFALAQLGRYCWRGRRRTAGRARFLPRS